MTQKGKPISETVKTTLKDNSSDEIIDIVHV